MTNGVCLNLEFSIGFLPNLIVESNFPIICSSGKPPFLINREGAEMRVGDIILDIADPICRPGVNLEDGAGTDGLKGVETRRFCQFKLGADLLNPTVRARVLTMASTTYSSMSLFLFRSW